MIKKSHFVFYIGGFISCGIAVFLVRFSSNLFNHKTNNLKLSEFEVDEDKFELDELLNEQLSRNISFLGKQGVKTILNSFVIVVGLGGVGSWAAIMLARSGIGKMRLIDFDMVTLSSLNRHAVADRGDVGISKTRTLARKIKKIAPFIKVEIETQMLNSDNIHLLLKDKPDFVLDCIDNIQSKVDLLKYCVQNSIKIISSMGAATKCDPTKVVFADISETIEDPLAKAVRRRLKTFGISKGIPTVFSIEKASDIKLLPLEDHKVNERNEYSTLPGFRVRVLPVLGTLPPIFGVIMANHIICRLSQLETFPMMGKNRTSMYLHIQKDMEKRYQNHGLNLKQVEYLVDEIWGGRSAISKNISKLCLVKWIKNDGISVQNLVLMTKDEAKEHEKIDSLDKHYSYETINYINTKFELEKKFNKFTQLNQHPYYPSINHILTKE